MSKSRFERGVSLAQHTTFHIGGTAQAFCAASTANDVVEAVWKAEGMGLPWQVIGQGSNILASDNGYAGAVISFKESSLPRIDDDGAITASGGLCLWDFVRFAAESGRSGFEDLAGIPGTLGGAIAGNAGAYGTSIGKYVTSVLLLDRAGIMRKVERDEIDFDYRWSSIKENGWVVLEATLSTTGDEPARIMRTISERFEDRARKHPDPGVVHTAGSFFKNPLGNDGTRVPAGKLIERAGCRGYSVGGASLWHSHGNIIVTEDGATAADVRELAERMAERVNESEGISLIPEVSFLG